MGISALEKFGFKGKRASEDRRTEILFAEGWEREQDQDGAGRVVYHPKRWERSWRTPWNGIGRERGGGDPREGAGGCGIPIQHLQGSGTAFSKKTSEGFN